MNRTTITGLLYCNGLFIPNGTTGLVRANGTYDYNTYTTFTTIENSFLKKSDAVLTYLNKNDASFIYLTKNDANNYVLISSLNSTLNSYAQNSTLNNYVLTTDFNSTLSNYALNSTLNSYVLTTALNSSLNNYVAKSGGTLTGDINMNDRYIINFNKLTHLSGRTLNIGYGNTINNDFTINACVGTNNSTNGNEQWIFGGGNVVTSNVSVALGSYNNINSFCGNAVGRTNILSATNCNAIGFNNTCSADFSIAIGNDITNSTANSCCIGDNAITQIYPNSSICSLGNTSKNFKDLYLSGSIKIQSANSINIGSGNVDNYASGVDNVNVIVGDLNTNFSNNNCQIGVANTNTSGAIFNRRK